MASEPEGVVRPKPGIVRQDLLLQLVMRVPGTFLTGHSSPRSPSSTIISRIAESDQTGSGEDAPLVGLIMYRYEATWLYCVSVAERVFCALLVGANGPGLRSSEVR